VRPGKGIGRFSENYLPGFHTLGVNHDRLVGYLVDRLGIPDLIANVSTMAPTYIYSVGQELLNIPSRSINFIFGADLPVPFEHRDSK